MVTSGLAKLTTAPVAAIAVVWPCAQHLNPAPTGLDPVPALAMSSGLIVPLGQLVLLAGVGEFLLPITQERDLVGEVVEQRGKPDAVLPREVGPQPIATLGAEGVLGRRRREVHWAPV